MCTLFSYELGYNSVDMNGGERCELHGRTAVLTVVSSQRARAAAHAQTSIRRAEHRDIAINWIYEIISVLFTVFNSRRVVEWCFPRYEGNRRCEC